MIFQYSQESVLIQRELIGFEAILKMLFPLCYRGYLTMEDVFFYSVKLV